jgi:4'-phosphopantetheinyl transferase
MYPIFNPPPPVLELEPGQIHVWSASLDQPDSCLQMFYQTLSQEERYRANRFVFEIDRRRFAVCRGILRSIIARYQGLNADSVSFKYGPNGKPSLDDLCCSESLYFNLSHSEGLALYAFALYSEVGVDVEYMRDISEIEHIAERIFSPGEIEVYRALSGEKKREAFFNGWTRKEALVKALGNGLSLPLDNFEVAFLPEKPVKVSCTEGNGYEIPRWSLRDLSPAVNYAGAFAVKNYIFETKCWRWDLNFN